MTNPFKVGDRIRLKQNKSNDQEITFNEINYSTIYEVSEAFDSFIYLEGMPGNGYLSCRFELATEEEEMKEEQLYFVIYYGKKGLYSASGMKTNEIILELNYDKPEKKDIRIYRWFIDKAPEFLQESEWPFTIEEVVRKETVFKVKE